MVEKYKPTKKYMSLVKSYESVYTDLMRNKMGNPIEEKKAQAQLLKIIRNARTVLNHVELRDFLNFTFDIDDW